MKVKALKHVVQLSILLVLVAFTQSCETEIPDEDPTPPTFSFHITGDGFDHTFNQDTDFDNLQLNLKNGETYTFTFIGSDAGGVERAQMFIGGINYIQLVTPLTSPWTYRVLTPLQDVIEWIGDASNPLTGAILTGDFRVSGRNIANSIRFTVEDFGGNRRRSNRISKELYLNLGDHPTELIAL